METPREPGNPWETPFVTKPLVTLVHQSQIFSDNATEKETEFQPPDSSYLRESTPVATEVSLAASSARSSRRSSTGSSHAEEDERRREKEHASVRWGGGGSSSEAGSEVFYPVAFHASEGNLRFQDATVEQDAAGCQQARPFQHHASPHAFQETYTKRGDATDMMEDRKMCSSAQENASAKAEETVQLVAADGRLRAATGHVEAGALHTGSSVQSLPPTELCAARVACPSTVHARTSPANYCVNTTSLVDTDVDLRSSECDPVSDASVTSSSLLSGSHSPRAEPQATARDAAEHSIYLQSYAFNQDNTCFLCATTAGFRVFTCAPLFEFMRRESSAWGEGSYEVAGMLFRTNVFAVVSTAEQKKVKLWDDQKKRFIGELRSRQPVINVCLGREVLAVVTEYTVYVYQSEQMRPFSIIHTGTNPRGLCIVTSTGEQDGWILACPAVAAGAVRVQTPDGNQTSHVFQAHQTPLAVMAFNSRGTWISTASETGTVIRIFCARLGQLLHELRRGTHSYAVSCLALRADDLFLAVASSSPTVHIFKLEQHEYSPQKHVSELTNAGTADGILGKASNRSSSDTRSTTSVPPMEESLYRSESATSTVATAATASSAAIGRYTSSSRARPPVRPVPLQQALSVGRELTSVVYDASKEIVNDVIKGVFFKYFSAVRSFAQFHVPVDQQAIDVRSPTSHILGPLCAFAGEISNHLYLLHPNGVFYEFRFDPNYGDECTLLMATPWFAPRPDFHIQSHLVTPSLPSELEGGHEGDEWQIVM